MNEQIRKVREIWFVNHRTPKNTTYGMIHSSPVIRFKNQAEINAFRNALGVSPSSSAHAPNGRNVVPGRNYYFMQTKPFPNLWAHSASHTAMFPMNKGYYAKPTGMYTYSVMNNIGLANKQKMNKYLHQKSLKELAAIVKNLKKNAPAAKAATILFSNIQKKRNLARRALEKWRYVAPMRAARRQWYEHLGIKRNTNQKRNKERR